MFGFDSLHVLMVTLGLAILLAYWLPRFLSGREPAASALLILAGAAAALLVPGLPLVPDPVGRAGPWEIASEFCVIVGLFGAGLRIDRVVSRARWMPTLRLLRVAMPVTILLVAVSGWALAGLSLAAALLLGAVLALLWPHFRPVHALVACALLFGIRPLVAWLALAGARLDPRQRWVVAFYGIRGVGSIYYLAFATTHAHPAEAWALWALVAFTILLSTLVHGLTAGIAVDRVTRV